MRASPTSHGRHAKRRREGRSDSATANSWQESASRRDARASRTTGRRTTRQAGSRDRCSRRREQPPQRALGHTLNSASNSGRGSGECRPWAEGLESEAGGQTMKGKRGLEAHGATKSAKGSNWNAPKQEYSGMGADPHPSNAAEKDMCLPDRY